jgi:hypothetical protein
LKSRVFKILYWDYIYSRPDLHAKAELYFGLEAPDAMLAEVQKKSGRGLPEQV